MAYLARVAMEALSGEALATEIGSLKALAADNPTMRCHIEPLVERYEAERLRRSVAEKEKPAEVAETGVAAAAAAGPLALDQAHEASSERGGRARTAPCRFGSARSLPALDPSHPHLSPEEGMQRDANRVMKVQLRHNESLIAESARNLACPLLCLEKLERGEALDGRRDSLLSTQMRRVAVADDGNRYDFEAIKRYVLKNMGTRLVSPITKQPMGAHVRTTVRKAHKTHKDRVIRKEIVWTPTLTEAAAGV
jgi:hypothetical protein